MKRALALIIACTLAACSSIGHRDAGIPSPEPSESAAAPVSAFEKAVTRDRIIVAGQPTLDDLKSLKERGIDHVFNVRGAEEMNPEAIGFDEAAELGKLGIGYSIHPIDKPEAYNPALLEAFKQEVDASHGKVLLHCTVGWRASNLYAAYAMKYLGMSADQAVHTLEPAGGWPLSIERLTGERLALVRREDFISAGFED